MNSVSYLKNFILGIVVFELDAHINSVQSTRQFQCKLRSEHNAVTFKEFIGLFTPIQQHAILRAAIILVSAVKNFVMLLLCSIESHC